MLHLQSGIHFQKVKTLVLAHDKFNGTGALVLYRLGQRHCLLTHGFAGFVADERRRRFLNHLLVATLDRAFAFVEVQHIALGITNQLDFNVARFFDKFFNEHPIIAKAVARLVAATGESFQRFLVIEGNPQSLTPTTSTGLDHDRIANASGDLDRFFSGFNRIIDTRNAIHTRRAGQFFGFNLVAHCGDRVVLGPDENDALFLDAFGELCVFAQEPVARMDRLRARLFASRNDFLRLQITVATGCRSDIDRLVGQHDVAGILVGVGIHGDGFNAHLAGGNDHAAGNFAAVCNQDFCKHAQSPIRESVFALCAAV